MLRQLMALHGWSFIAEALILFLVVALMTDRVFRLIDEQRSRQARFRKTDHRFGIRSD